MGHISTETSTDEKNCESKNLYEKISVNSRRQWSQNLPLLIESYYNHYLSKQATNDHMEVSGMTLDPQFPYGHSRFDLLGPVGPNCRDLEVYGQGDEEKRACGLKYFKGDQCIVFSIGSANIWGFEESIYHKTNCTVHVFDCTVAKEVEPPSSITTRVHLHKVCIGDKNVIVDSKRFMTWESILTLTKMTQPPTYLKMDIEGWEYSVLHEIILSGKHLPRQIAFEMHYKTYPSGLPWSNRAKSPSELAIFMDFLFRNGNYFLVDRHDNVFCAHCTELLIDRLCA